MGDVARRLYDRTGKGVLIDVDRRDIPGTLARTMDAERPPAGVRGGLLGQWRAGLRRHPAAVTRQSTPQWRMVEVKASGSVKDHYHDDCAVQAYCGAEAGLPSPRSPWRIVDTKWVYSAMATTTACSSSRT